MARARLPRLVAIAILAVAAGCNRYHVRTDWQPGTDFTALSTYEWLERPEGAPPRDPRVDNQLFADRLREAVETELAAKGYRPADRERADFVLRWDAWVQARNDVSTYPGWGFGFGGFHGGPGFWGVGVGTDVYVDQYDEATLVLDVLEPETQRLLWRGTSETRLRDAGTPEQRTERIRRIVHAMLERFPPPPPKD
jgi:hypothetical protein